MIARHVKGPADLKDTPRMRKKIREGLLESMASGFHGTTIGVEDLFTGPRDHKLTMAVMEDLVQEGLVLEITDMDGAPSDRTGIPYQSRPRWWLASRRFKVRGGELRLVKA